MLSSDNTTSLTTQYPDIYHSNNNNNALFRSFLSDYNGPIIILAESIDQNNNLGNWHPFKTAKFFSTNFTSITNIKIAGSKKIKITFNSITNGNQCLNSKIPFENGFQVTIPTSLIFLILNLITTFRKRNFLRAMLSRSNWKLYQIVFIYRIFIKKDGNIIETCIVELKFIATKIPSVISLFNILFEVKPRIRSPVQCNGCLRFGHTQKYCRSTVQSEKPSTPSIHVPQPKSPIR